MTRPPDEILPVHLTTQTRVLAALAGLLFLVIVFELIRRERLQERYAVIWVASGVLLVAASVVPSILELLARTIGVRDTNAALFTLVILVLLGLAFHFTVTLSRQSEQITRLAQELAIERARTRDHDDDIYPT